MRAVMDPPFGGYAIYEHCLPFNVSRAYDEARASTIPWSGPTCAIGRCGPAGKEETMKINTIARP